MKQRGTLILQNLAAVAAERATRALDAGLARRVWQLKRYQQARFALTYADLLATPRYAGAASFFLDDLYGPGDFALRDSQFARIVPGLVRLFPAEVVLTVEALTALHALSERLDSEMARRTDGHALTPSAYVEAWRLTGQVTARQQQLALMLEVGRSLDLYTRRPLLRHSLRAMRAPARAAGLGALQAFLERGFETFRGLRGAHEFLAEIEVRERAIAASLFGTAGASHLLGQLP
jgi:hypothetical protein